MKLTNRLLIISGGLIAVLALGLTVALLPAPHSQDGLIGHWTVEQKANAEFVMQSQPVAESQDLAVCVISKLSTQLTYADFLLYAKMVSSANFTNPDSAQGTDIYDVMAAALSCPQGS